MATLVSPQLRSIAAAIVDKCGYTSAVLSGIVPDSRHLDNGGYHVSVEDLRKFGNGGDYSNTRPDDRNLNPRYGAAFDVTMSTKDMIKSHKRVHAVWADKDDPRRKYVNCINTWDGTGDAVRLDFVTGAAKYASPDHKWHVHGELRRRYLLDAKAARAVISMFAGESKATWIAREENPVAAALKPVASTKPATAPAPKVYKPGSRLLRYIPGKPVLKGADVTWLQRFIGVTKAGRPDGSFGARTRAAVQWYQGMKGLKVDGEVGPKTWSALGIKSSF